MLEFNDRIIRALSMDSNYGISLHGECSLVITPLEPLMLTTRGLSLLSFAWMPT